MPHGYTKQTDTDRKVVFRKTHRNGEQTDIVAEVVPNDGRWFAHVEDGGRTEELGRFGSKTDAKEAAKNWARRNPKGIPAGQQGISGIGGGIPGMDGNGLF